MNFVLCVGLTSGGLWYDGPQGRRTPEPPPRVPRGRAAPFLKTPDSADGRGVSRRLVRAIRRANRAGADAQPTPAQDTRGKGTAAPGPDEGERHDRNRPPPRTGGKAGRRAGARRRSPRHWPMPKTPSAGAAAPGRPRALPNATAPPAPSSTHLRQLLSVLDWAGSPPARTGACTCRGTGRRALGAAARRQTRLRRQRGRVPLWRRGLCRQPGNARVQGRGWKTWSAASGRSRSTTAARAA